MAFQETEIAALTDTLRDCLPQKGSNGTYNREQLKDVAERLSIALETPGETCQRVTYYPLRTTIVRIATRLNILNILVNNTGPVSGKELSQKTGADHLLIIRLMRFLVAMHVVGEAGVDSYVATNITRHLTIPRLEAGTKHTYDIVCMAVMQLDPFLAKTGYKNPTDPKHYPFQDAFHTEDSLFEWFPKHPEYLNNFNLYMTGQRDGRANWLAFFPFEEQLVKGFEGGNDAVMLVDVGSARGHEVENIKTRYPHLPGRFILQDLPETAKQALDVKGMEVIEHDFFTPQPINGARAYYLRNIMHDWPDSKCQEILSQIKLAMKSGYSRILLNELVLPDKGMSLTAAQIDITMMAALAATERTERQWRELIDSVGLKIEKIWTKVVEEESIIELVLE